MYEKLSVYDVILILGNYGAGKSYIAKTYFNERKRINRLEIRHMIKSMTEHGEKWDPNEWDEDIEGLIKHIEYDVICYFLERNKRIIIDNTSLTKKSRKRYIEYAKRYKKSIACVFLKRDINYLLEQNKKRSSAVPEHIIVKLYSKTEVPSSDEGFNLIELG